MAKKNLVLEAQKEIERRTLLFEGDFLTGPDAKFRIAQDPNEEARLRLISFASLRARPEYKVLPEPMKQKFRRRVLFGQGSLTSGAINRIGQFINFAFIEEPTEGPFSVAADVQRARKKIVTDLFDPIQLDEDTKLLSDLFGAVVRGAKTSAERGLTQTLQFPEAVIGGAERFGGAAEEILKQTSRQPLPGLEGVAFTPGLDPASLLTRGAGFLAGKAGAFARVAPGAATAGLLPTSLEEIVTGTELASAVPRIARGVVDFGTSILVPSTRFEQGLIAGGLALGTVPVVASKAFILGLGLTEKMFKTAPFQALIKKSPQVKGLFEKVVASKEIQNVRDSVTELIRGGKLTPNELDTTAKITDAIVQAGKSGKIKPEDLSPALRQLIAKEGLSPEQFWEEFGKTISKGGRDLAQMSIVKRAFIRAFPENSEALGILKQSQVGPTLFAKVRSKIRVFEEGIAKGGRTFIDETTAALTAQPATTVRNIESQGAFTATQLFEQAVADALKLPGDVLQNRPAFADTFEFHDAIMRAMSEKDIVNLSKMLDTMPIEKTILMNTPTQEVVYGSGFMSELNILNHMQERFFRLMLFDAKINQLARKAGVDISDIRNIEKISSADKREAVEFALRGTFAANPENFVARGLVKIYKEFPVLKLIANPFPRFWGNAIDFLINRSPAGTLRLLGDDVLEKALAGNPDKAARIISEAYTGLQLFGAGMAIRSNPEFAGEKWYEIRLSDGKTIDARAFAPFSTYMFIAEAMIDLGFVPDPTTGQIREVPRLSGSDWAQGLVAINRVAGSQLYVLEGITGTHPPTAEGQQRLINALTGWGGEVFGRLTVPVKATADFASLGDPEEGIVRDKRLIANQTGVRLVERPEGGMEIVQVDPASERLEAQGFPNVARFVKGVDAFDRMFFPGATQIATNLVGPFISNIPGASRALAPRPQTVGTGPLRRERGEIRQLTGLTIRTKNDPQAELDRLGIQFRDRTANLGSARLNNYINEVLAPINEATINAVMNSPSFTAELLETKFQRPWEDLSDTEKKIVVIAALKRQRNSVQTAVLKSMRANPEGLNILLKAGAESPGARKRIERVLGIK